MLCAAFEPLNSLIPSMIRFQLAPVCHASSVFVDHVDALACRVIVCADATQKYVVGRGNGDGDRDRRREGPRRR